MPRESSPLRGLVLGVLAGGILGTALAWLVDLGNPVPGVGTGVGAAVAAGIGYLVAWLVLSRRAGAAPADDAEPEPARVDPPPIEDVAEAALVQDDPVEAPAVRHRTDAAPAGLLAADCVTLAGSATGRAGAIDEVGALLVASGAVEPEYVEAMHTRELGISTHMGNLLAVPHGDHDARRLVRRSALALVRYPDTIDWHGNRVRFVVAIAGTDDADQVRLVSRVAEVFLDEAAVGRLEAARTPDEAAGAFAATGG